MTKSERMKQRRANPEYRERMSKRQATQYREAVGAAGRYKRGKHPQLTYCIADGHGRVKIGRTVNVDYRMMLLQAGNADELVLVGTIEGDHEARLQQCYASYAIRGEWFTAVETLLEEFAP